MTDRKPTAPGQYQMTVSADEAQKLLIGEAVTVTLVRDDQPEVEGTPYNKASVLPDELAAKICPSITDPTPADAYSALHGSTVSVVLLSGDDNWPNNQQIATVVGVTADNRIDVSPEPSRENREEYNSCGIWCIAQSTNRLTFECDSVPGFNVVANVSIRA